MNFEDKIEIIESKSDFISFVELLVQNLRDNPEEWENKTLPDFLQAVASWTEDMEGYYENNDIPLPEHINWRVIADILVAAKMYE